METSFDQVKNTLGDLENHIFNLRAITIFVVVIVLTYLIIKLLSFVTNRLLIVIINYTEKSKGEEKKTAVKRAETWLNVFLAVAKIFIIALGFYITWKLLYPIGTPFAVVGAGAFFIVLAGGTISPLLRDFTVGSMMIVERWYGVGDYIKVEPFDNVQGIVEQLTLRSTKIRSLSGEVIWVHNQYIQGVKVKYRGFSTMALDVFVRDKEKALKLLNSIIDIAPKGPMLIIDGLKITEIEELNEFMWRIELVGKTVPGREWLIEKFIVDSIIEADAQHESEKRIIVYGPLTRYVDQAAERRFKRAIK